MPKLRVNSFAISLDGYAAARNQSLEDPLGEGGLAVFQWFFATDAFRKMHTDGTRGSTGIDNDFALRGFHNVGAWILGRNMFGPIRGHWPDVPESDAWKGWWGDDPPYHVPVFVLTNHPRESIPMAGDTTFHFVTGGIHAALERATEAANDTASKGKDIRIGGGVATIRQYLLAGLIDELHLAIAPVLLGTGEHLLQGIDLRHLGYEVTEHVPTPAVTHIVLTRRT